ncbi:MULTISPECIES: PP2C family protein-serine/threonine phosphatase [unclassified Nocardioides]|uniref:PP2C family protein-serine/threonine phosphatase n=1 Tax=unclassified Nocardioides TaxID=2615069 RepID=UPI00070281E3|nr:MULTISPECIES: protein phosphatase 2C domain-containing protein [unclassified Nocardioides]KRC53333.1 protein phosphatase [Nocardioides sp. Root79]KRC70670.1 protein phosphatase [Nocardioides sp. Root240]
MTDPTDDTVDRPVRAPKPPLRLDFYAVSDVGRVRKDNQDSGYAGPWLLAVCDGVGGAARGDIASGTAVNELRSLDVPPGSADALDRVSDGIHEAHVAIGAQVDQDPALNGTSTTATVALFDGSRLALGHVGDSRAYLLRDGELSQLTSDHTFVQSLIDEGRITEEEARVHPHRNLILKALDGLHDVEPDLFALELVAGDRLFLCSDGACGVLVDARIAEILTGASPEFSSIEMVRASLEAGSSDNVTCVVADVAEATPDDVAPEPMVVGAAADLRQRRPRALFRGHRSGDTGELEPVTAEIPDIPEGVEAIAADPRYDPEAMRYAPQPPPRFIWPRRLLALAVAVGLVWVVLGTAWWWSQRQYYVGEDAGKVVIFRGVEVPGLSKVFEVSDVALADLPEDKQSIVEDGISYGNDYDAAREKVEQLATDAQSGTATDLEPID